MSKAARIGLIAGASVLGLFTLVASAFALDRMAHSGEVLRGVQVGPTELGGLDEIAAMEALLGLEDLLAAETLPVVVEDTEFDLDPLTVGFDVDQEAAHAAAAAVGREGGLITQFRWWLDNVFATNQLPIPASVVPADVRALMKTYEVEALDSPPFNGSVEVDGTRPVAMYPAPGRGINPLTAEVRISNALVQLPRPTVMLDVVSVAPAMSVEDVDAAVRDAQQLLSGPIELTRTDPDFTVLFTHEDLAAALLVTTQLTPIPQMTVGFDPLVIGRLLEPVRAELESPPKDAQLIIDEDDNVILEEGRPGSLVDAQLAAQAVEDAARRGTRTAELPFQDGAPPEVTTEDLAKLGIVEKVSEFTTFHPCCQARVTNIHIFADLVDGAIVMPGEEFSLNDHVGRRTTEAGFLPAPTIIGGKLEDTVGGGVSQFATTFYNAVFYGGYEDVSHNAHSYYFSRYPEGIEATISWPAPDLVFRNDTDAAVLIKTQYTDESITVKFFGDDGGREVEGIVSDRFGWTDPPVEYIAVPTRDPADGERVVLQGARGWSVSVTRVITEPNGSTVEDSWTVRYRAQPREIELHPCLIPEGAAGHTGEECPVEEETTTTVDGGDPTTTVPGDTTPTTAPPDDTTTPTTTP
ncbi:MAG: VanW family protein [Acidimicrobiia bacterium]|nr:VanW family protein [Acidimicrobiia bacterium]